MDDERSDRVDSVRSELGSDMGLRSLVAHLYRGEVEREVSWRERLDSTTNFAVTVMAAVLAYAFAIQGGGGSGGSGHEIILIAMVIGVTFLTVEARRFREYDIWRSRVRTLQENLFAEALDPGSGVEQEDWREQLSRDYRHPSEKIAYHTALAHRLRRVYLPLLFGLLVIWLFHLSAYGERGDLIADASIQGLPGIVVFGGVLACYAALVALALGTSPAGEIGGETDPGHVDERR